MKLTKEQIQHIDEYLQRSGVTYWDVRMELLDHFIVAIEEKIETEELFFEDALLEVTIAFGNSVQERHLLNRDRTEVLFSGIFANNKGFNELEAKKRKQIKRQYLKQFWTQLKENFTTQRFYIDYLFFTILLYVSFQYYIGWLPAIAIVWLCLEIVKTLYLTSRYKAAKNSLHIEVSSKILSTFLIIIMHSYIFIRMRNGVNVELVFWVAITMLFVYPIVKTSLFVHKNIYAKYKKYHELIT